MRNIYAMTSSGVNYPEYISVNLCEHSDVEVIVRGHALEFGFCGPTASIVLTREQAKELAQKLLDL